MSRFRVPFSPVSRFNCPFLPLLVAATVGLSATVGNVNEVARFLSGVKRKVTICKHDTHRDFNIEVDSTYRRGDALMMLFTSVFMYQTGSKNGLVYMAVEYDDTVVSRNLRFSVSGLSQLRVPEDTTRKMRAVKGYFYLDGANDKTTSTRLLFLDNVQLIRFHTIDDDKELPKDSIPRGADGRRLASDTVSSGDSIRSGDSVLPIDTGAALHRMDARQNRASTR